jgi:hypothetical protein
MTEENRVERPRFANCWYIYGIDPSDGLIKALENGNARGGSLGLGLCRTQTGSYCCDQRRNGPKCRMKLFVGSKMSSERMEQTMSEWAPIFSELIER